MSDIGRTGYDFDGVITAGIVPSPNQTNAVIITGSLVDDWPRVRELLDEFYARGRIPFRPPVYMRPNGKYGCDISAAYWKVEMIKQLGLCSFYEDDRIQATIIKTLLPHLNLMFVFRGKPRPFDDNDCTLVTE